MSHLVAPAVALAWAMAVLAVVFCGYILWSGRDRIASHFLAYSKSYLVGLVFILLAFASAFVGEFGNIARATRQGWDTFDWSVHYGSMIASALTTILAFLNPTVAQDRAKRAPPTP